MMAEILNDPVKATMLVIVVILEVSAITALVTMWVKAKKASKEREE